MKSILKNSLWLIGIIGMAALFGILGFTIYMIPYLLFDMNYEMPLFIAHYRAWLESMHGLFGFEHILFIIGPLILIMIILFFLMRFITMLFDREKEKQVKAELAGAGVETFHTFAPSIPVQTFVAETTESEATEVETAEFEERASMAPTPPPKTIYFKRPLLLIAALIFLVLVVFAAIEFMVYPPAL